MRRDLTTGDIPRLILRLAWPTAVAMSLEMAFGIVDGIFVSRYSKDAFAGVTVVFPASWVMFGLSAIIGVGTTSLVARSLGAGDEERANRAAANSFWMAVIMVVAFLIAGFAVMVPLFRRLAPSPEVLQQVLKYAPWVLAGSVSLFLGQSGAGILRAQGDMHTPMVVMVVGVLLNAVLDPLLIFGLGPFPEKGVAGAAIATFISRGVGCGLLYVLLLRHTGRVRLRFRGFRWDSASVVGILKVGLPASANQLVMAVGAILIIGILKPFGKEAVSGYGYVGRLHGMVILPCLGIAIAVMSIVGQNVGARLYDRAEKTAWTAALYSMVIVEAVGVAFFAVPRLWLSIFSPSPEAMAHAVSLMRTTSLTFMFIGVSITLGHAFQGAGKAVPALIVTALRLVVLAVPLAWWLSRTVGVEGIWWAMAISTVVAGTVSALWFYSGAWKPADAR